MRAADLELELELGLDADLEDVVVHLARHAHGVRCVERGVAPAVRQVHHLHTPRGAQRRGGQGRGRGRAMLSTRRAAVAVGRVARQ